MGSCGSRLFNNASFRLEASPLLNIGAAPKPYSKNEGPYISVLGLSLVEDLGLKSSVWVFRRCSADGLWTRGWE